MNEFQIKLRTLKAHAEKQIYHNNEHISEEHKFVLELANKFETIQKEKAELIQVLNVSDEIICNLCKRLNPQHKDCTSCSDRDYRMELLK